MTKTLYRKLVDSHTVVQLDEENVLLYADLHLMNEYTSPQAFAGLGERGITTLMPGQNVSTVSHIIPTHPVKFRIISDTDSALQASNLKRNCDRHGIPLFDTNDHFQGIEHVIAPEHGMIRPGMVVLCGDSHTTTYGALGALGFGIGTTEVEHILATQTLVYRYAGDMRIRVDGQLPRGTTAKDLVLMIIAQIGAQGARGYVVEFCGSAVGRSVSKRASRLQHGGGGRRCAPDRARPDHDRLRPRPLPGPGENAQRKKALSQWQDLRSDDGAS
jgi:3-isopropylmalate/(R)-2-methylmalate dehydratase large subunit